MQMHCTLPLPELLFSSPITTLSNMKAFLHADQHSSKGLVAGLRFHHQFYPRFKLGHAIFALATVHSESLDPISSWESQIGSDLNIGSPLDVFQEVSDLDEKEKLRRSRISRANKGNIPWNKGKKHSPETIQRIRERTKIAMQNPKTKEIWRRRRETKMIQEACHVEWCHIIAEVARVGFYGDGLLRWG